MIRSIQHSRRFEFIYRLYIAAFFVYLAAPLTVVCVFAFNDSALASLPWRGFTLDWFLAAGEDGRTGLFHDRRLMASLGVSARVAIAVTIVSVTLGTMNAFLFERFDFPGKNMLYMAMLLPLVIPGVILGVSILVFSSTVANQAWDRLGLDLGLLRPGLLLVVLGQASFIATLCTLIISARLRKFDQALEEAALNLGASRPTALLTVTIPYLRPAIIGAAIMAFLMSFENFNTTLMLVGSDAPVTITLFNRLREGSTPVLNAISLLLIAGSGFLALLVLALQSRQR